jgi:hypothetical protein
MNNQPLSAVSLTTMLAVVGGSAACAVDLGASLSPHASVGMPMAAINAHSSHGK